ncbi:MAG: hypothetical protein J1F35_03900 [Erysipelotrichales bacterium]|nr:hypothetical protein [Erysipelotrichales bacterium]
MNKLIIGLGSFAFILLIVIVAIKSNKNNSNIIEGEVLYKSSDMLVFKDNNDLIYNIDIDIDELSVGDKVALKYTGILNKNSSNQDISVIAYAKLLNAESEDLSTWNDNGIFSKFYKQAYNKLQTLSIDEKIGQLLIARYPESKEGNKYNLAGYVFYQKDFDDKGKDEVIEMIDSLNDTARIPLFIAVDEEGGRIIRVSSNSKLVETPFKSSKELYDEGGFDLISEDTKKKSDLLSSLHINVNLAPVVDIAENTDSYIYPRTIGYGVEITSKYASTVINASKTNNVSYVLKHFPGYGDSTDTHNDESINNTDYDEIINKNIIPFKSGIDAGAEAVLVSHNTYTSIDDEPASLSSGVHNILKSELKFTGVTITDDLDMGATSDINNKYLNALLAGNDLLIVTDYESAFKEIKKGLTDGDISEDYIDKLVLKVLSWKYYKLLLLENNK